MAKPLLCGVSCWSYRAVIFEEILPIPFMLDRAEQTATLSLCSEPE